ncbi:unnamed protein product [Trifolium pratense]|uniref:Uncharacterized protein n=2 Tax=Trifolium pratense TaxID=57577 RepID=A0ACB0LFS7_TRIPR|nr:unnamed protein product [Trifolium pratense]
MRFRAITTKLYSSCLLANSKPFLTASSAIAPSFLVKTFDGSIIPQFQGSKNNSLFPRVYMSASSALLDEEVRYKGTIELLKAVEDQHGGVIINIDEPMDSYDFASMLEDSLSQWRTQGKKGVWIKLPRKHSYLVASAVEAGFKYHHAEPDYLMLVYWIPNTPNTIPANASHRISIGAFVVNANMEVLVVQEKNGRFSGKGIWKLPTGAVDVGEDVCDAAIREVKEETGIDTEFVEVLAFRERHNCFFQKSEILFICMLQPHSFIIQSQASEIEDAKWMAIEDYVAQPFLQQNELFDFLTKVGLSKLKGKYSGFSTLLTSTSSCKSHVYINKNDSAHLLTSKHQQP